MTSYIFHFIYPFSLGPHSSKLSFIQNIFYFIPLLQLVLCSALFVKLNFPFTELFYLFLLSLVLILRYMSYFYVFFASSKSPETLETSRCSSPWLVCCRRVDPVASFRTVYEFGRRILCQFIYCSFRLKVKFTQLHILPYKFLAFFESVLFHSLFLIIQGGCYYCNVFE